MRYAYDRLGVGVGGDGYTVQASKQDGSGGDFEFEIAFFGYGTRKKVRIVNCGGGMFYEWMLG